MEARAEARYRLEHADEPQPLSTVEEIDALIDSLLTGPAYENLAQIHSLERAPLPSGFPDHELLLGVDRDLRAGVLAFMDADGNVVTSGDAESRTDPVYYIQETRTEFPAHSEIPLDLVRRAAAEFISSGGQRPTCVEWQQLDS